VRALALGAIVACGVLIGLGAPAGGQSPNAVKKLNPYTGNEKAIQEGRTLYLQRGCSGCHGVMGGGGMAMPLIDDVWKFGSSDEILFKLIKGEVPESTMPKVFNDLEPDQVWKMLAYIRSLYAGDPKLINW
jgi:mono/diheme cytochrome c family protein